MSPGGDQGYKMTKWTLKNLRFGAFIEKNLTWVGVHGSYMPFCKSCMVQVARKLRENHSFTQTAHQGMAEEDRQVAESADRESMNLALMAGLLSQQFIEMSKVAKEKLPDEGQGDAMAVDA